MAPAAREETKLAYIERLLSNRNQNSAYSIGYCPARICQTIKGTINTTMRSSFSEALASPSYPRVGRVRYLGLPAQPCYGRTAATMAVDWVKANWQGLKDHFHEIPYIDVTKLLRYHTKGKNKGKPVGGTKKPVPEPMHGAAGDDDDDEDDQGEGEGEGALLPDNEDKAGPHVDIFIHIPPDGNSAYMMTSMVIAIVMMAWQLPVNLHEWSVVAEIGLEDGRLTGTASLTTATLQRCAVTSNMRGGLGSRCWCCRLRTLRR